MEKEMMNAFKPAILVLFMVLVPAACRYENPYELQLTCNSTFMKIRYKFEKPFKGFIYIDGYRFDPDCSIRTPPLSTYNEITLPIHLSSCGTRIQLVPNGRSVIENTVIIQQHNILRTSKDIIEPVSCSVLGLEYSCPNIFTLNKPKSEITSSKIPSELELKSGQKALGIQLASELQLFNKPLLVFSVPNNGDIKDINIRNCILHEKMILDEDSFFYQITHPSGCQNTSSDVMSAFAVVNNTESGNLVAYAQMKPFYIKAEHGLYISCGAQLCKQTCKRKCPKKSESDVVHAIATHSISKRSIDNSSNKSTRKESDVRNRLLRSTIKALSQKLLKQVKSQNDTRFGKRALSIEQKEETKIPEESSNSGILSYNLTNSNEASSTISSGDFDGSLFKAYEGLEAVQQLKEDDYEGSVTTITTLPEKTSKEMRKKYDDQYRALKSGIKILTEKLKGSRKQKLEETLEKWEEDVAKKGKLTNFEGNVDAVKKDIPVYPEESVDAVKKDKQANPDSEESVDSKTSTVDFLDSDIESDDYELTLNTFMEQDDLTKFEKTDDFDKIFHLTTLPTTSLPQDIKVTATDGFTTISNLNLGMEDLISQTKIDSKNFSVNFNVSESMESDYENPLNHSCVPKLTFLVVSIVLGFIIFTLLLVCCGMALYIRKEKKRHLIDNFLLYNFY